VKQEHGQCGCNNLMKFFQFAKLPDTFLFDENIDVNKSKA